MKELKKQSYVSINMKSNIMKIIMVVISVVLTTLILSIRANEKYMWPSQALTVNVYAYICLIILAICLIVDRNLKGHDFETIKSWIFFIVLYAISLFLTVGLTFVDDLLRPLCIIPMLFSLFYELRYGFLATIMFSALFVLLSGEAVESLLLMVLIGAVGCVAARFYVKLKTIAIGAVLMLVAAFFINLLFYYMLYEEINAVYAFEHIVSVLIAVIALLVVSLLYKPTKKAIIWNSKIKEKLMKLSSPDSPAYKYMKSASIPVFTHSTDVMELAVIGAKSIAIDDVLVKCGALYHDIGKCESTDYIKVGVNIARKFKMPENVIKIIKEHNVSVKLPTTKEAAVVMLADSVYTSYDYLAEKNPGKKIDMAQLINSVFNNRLDKGTLNDTGLSVEEFSRVKQSFIDWTSMKN